MRVVVSCLAAVVALGIPLEATASPPPGAKTASASSAKTVAFTPDRPDKRQAGKVEAVIDLSKQRMTVSIGGIVEHVWPISSGRGGYTTPGGTFRPKRLEQMWFSRKYDNAPMPYAVFFNGGIATHGTSATGMLGRPASHGCIRLNTGNAKTFHDLVKRHGIHATRIVVSGQTPPSNSVAMRRDEEDGERPSQTPRFERQSRPMLYERVRLTRR